MGWKMVLCLLTASVYALPVSAIEKQAKQESHRTQKHQARKSPSDKALRSKAEADNTRHESALRYRQFQMMQQAQQRGYQTQLQTQQQKSTHQ